MGPDARIQYLPGFPKKREHSFSTWSHKPGLVKSSLGQVRIKARIHSLRGWPNLSYLPLCFRLYTLPLRACSGVLLVAPLVTLPLMLPLSPLYPGLS